MTNFEELMKDEAPTDALDAMRNAMENALDYRKMAVGDDSNPYYHSIADREQKRAIMLAQVAQAEALAIIARRLSEIAANGLETWRAES